MDIGLACLIGVVVLGVVFFLIFWKPIAERIRDIKGIGKEGVVFRGEQEDSDPEAAKRKIDELTRNLNSQLLNELEDAIKVEVKGWNLDDKEVVNVLIKHQAAVQIAYHFEVIYRWIFGSQLNALEFLNAQTVGQPSAVLRNFYGAVVTQYPDIYRSISFDAWLGFLKDAVLITESNGLLHITVRGREFLTHITKAGLSKYKVL